MPEQPSQHIDDIESMDVGDIDFSETVSVKLCSLCHTPSPFFSEQICLTSMCMLD